MTGSPGRLRPLVALLMVLMLFGAACNGDDGGNDTRTDNEAPTDGDQAQDLRDVTVLIPFPGMSSFFSFPLADHLGYFEDEGLNVTVEAADGSSAVVQQLVGGNAEVGVPGAGPFISAVAQGEDLVSVYVFATRNPYSLVVPADSEVDEISDLDGMTVGISEFTGGEVPILRSLLSAGDVDADVVETGGGDAASVALEQGSIDAYMSSFPDIIAIDEQGVEVTEVSLGQFDTYFDTSLVVERSMTEEDPDLIVGLGRALAKGTVYGVENPEASLRIIEDLFPEQVTDFEESLRLFNATIELRTPIEEADGQWGYHPPSVWAGYVDFLLEQGEIEQEVDPTSLYTSDFLDEINDFDEEEVREAARQAE